jgi:hypothetical protein
MKAGGGKGANGMELKILFLKAGNSPAYIKGGCILKIKEYFSYLGRIKWEKRF